MLCPFESSSGRWPKAQCLPFELAQRWVDFAEGESQSSDHWMPYQDSRMVSEFYGGIAGGSYTAEQHQNFVQQMRSNVQRIAKAVRAIPAYSEGVK
jgi:hypothetical protein